MIDLWLAAILDSTLKGLALCFAAGAAALLLKRSSAAARNLVWRLAFAGLLALPVLATLLPAWRVPIPDFAREARAAAPIPTPLPTPIPTERQAGPSPVSTAAVDPEVPSPTFAGITVEPRGWNPSSWRAVAFGLWSLGALGVLAALGIALLRVRWQGRRARPVADAAWGGLLRQVRGELGVRRPVALVVGGDRAMPMTWGWRRPVVLLPAGAEAWPEARRRAVLLHELAHVARQDYPAQLAAEAVRALYWFNPLVWMAARRLRIESEHACDDQVLAAGARPSDYAGDLLDIARSLRALRAAAPAGLAMARPSQLAGRLLAVLDARRDRRGVSRRLALPAWLVAACLVLPLAALAPLAKPVAMTADISINGDQTFEWSDNGHKIKIRSEGKFELTDDWTAVANLSRGAWMRLVEDDGRTERRLDVEPGSDGRPVYTWKVDGKQRAFDAEGRKWIQGMLLALVRGAGYDADRRVEVILKRQGPEGVLAEISQIPSAYVKAIYFKKLLAHRDLGAPIVERAVEQAGREIKSDYELANTLIAAVRSQALTDRAVTACAEAARSIRSDYERRRALAELVDRARLTPASLAALLRAAQGIKSSYGRGGRGSRAGRLARPPYFASRLLPSRFVVGFTL
jgi:beta-lactamase regulating signal transducer with metallopeptidase domain